MLTCDEMLDLPWIVGDYTPLCNLWLVLLYASDAKLRRYSRRYKWNTVSLLGFYGFTPSMIFRIHERGTWLRSKDLKHLSLPPEVHRQFMKHYFPISPNRKTLKALRKWGKEYRMAMGMSGKKGQPHQLELSFFD